MPEDSTAPAKARPEAEWLFGRFQLSAARGRLWSAGSEIPLARRSFELLIHLVRHRDRLVPREELLASVWGGVSVSDAAVASVIRDLRRALGDSGTGSHFIKTVRGRGFRFVHAVSEASRESEERPNAIWDLAADHLARALEALELVESSRGRSVGGESVAHTRDRSDLIVALARARWSAGATAEARAAFLDAAHLAKQSGDAEVLAQAALGYVGRSDVTPGVNLEGVELLEESLKVLPSRDSALRAEVLARLGTEVYYDEDWSRSDGLTAQALAMAERVGDDPVTAYVLTARHFACQRPDVAPSVRIELAKRAVLLAGACSSDVLILALQECLIDLFEMGDGKEFLETFERYEQAVENLAQPFFEWLLSMFQGTRAILEGRIERAEELAHATLAIGQRVRTPNAEGIFAAQLFAIRREQGRLAELEAAFESAVRGNDALPIYRAGRAAVLAASSPSRASLALEEVMTNDLDDFPRDQNWIATLGTLVPAAIAAGGERRIRQLRDLLAPYAGRMIIIGQGAATHGAVNHHLGLLHAALGESEAAVLRFDEAMEIHERARAPLWLAHTRRARASL